MATEMVPAGMGRCEITGQIVPEDELVTINNQRVSAEGKAILLDRLKAGEAMPGELERPTILRRFGCIFLDNIIVAVPAFIISFVFGLSAAGAGAAGGPGGMNMLVAVGQLIGVAVSITYFALMHGSQGRTLGKMAGKLKVVRMDGKPMNIATGFIRALAYQGPSILPPLFLLVLPAAASLGANLLVAVYGLANIIAALADSKEQRALHDRIAGTRVIMTEK